MLTPTKPPIAELTIWESLRPYWNLQPGSKNQRRFVLRRALPASLQMELDGVRVPCVCGEMFCPFREGMVFFTAYHHTSCSTTDLVERWALWAKLDIGKLHAENVQYSLYE